MPRLHSPRWEMDCAPFEALVARPPETLTADERASLRCLRAVQAARVGRDDIQPAADRTTAWAQNAISLERWVAQEGRLPVENNRRAPTPRVTEENRLAQWLRYERLTRTQARRCSFQRTWIKTVPSELKRTRTRRWQLMARSYRLFVATERRAPRYRSTSDRERRLAAWAAKQRWRYRTERLNAHRVSCLEALPFWSWGSHPHLSAAYVARIRLLAWEYEAGLGAARVDLRTLNIVLPVPQSLSPPLPPIGPSAFPTE